MRYELICNILYTFIFKLLLSKNKKLRPVIIPEKKTFEELIQ